jgi:hypothetical protein
MHDNTTIIDNIKKYLKIATSFSLTKLGLLLVRHPMHVIQTNKQAYPALSNSQIIQNIYATNGVKGFYNSTTASVMKILLGECYRGPLMIEMPRVIEKHLPENVVKNHPTIKTIIAIPVISLIDATIICPLVKLSTDQITRQQQTTLKEISAHYWKEGYFKHFYRGYRPLLLQTSNLWGAFFLIDDMNKAIIRKYVGEVSYSTLMAASISGGILQTFINVIPDTIRVQMQRAHSSPQSATTVAKNLVKTHGIRALFFALPHKFAGNIVGYGYKSMLRQYWSTPNPVKKSPVADIDNTNDAPSNKKNV